MSGSTRIHTYPDPVLKTKAASVEEIDGEVQTLIDTMAEAMYAAPGIGLAANQVGALKRVIIYDVTPHEAGKDLAVLINPEIVSAEGRILFEEACLSVVDFSAQVERHARVAVRGLDRRGRPLDIEAEGLLAVCLQHEIDHLDGILYIDHISQLKRTLYNKKLRKMLKKGTLPQENDGNLYER